ncbi:MAG TPA: cysteine desulfurase-like protein [Thermoanaerobaculia bacterium]|nr:cysteine desulfurase-like protein [Thermoanaerobaculia bacterium]
MQTAESRTGERVLRLEDEFVRSQFPALTGEWVFLDNAGGSQVLRSAADRIRDFLLTSSVSLGAPYEASRLAGERVAEGALAGAALVNADPGEIVLGPSATQLVVNLARAMTESFLHGDEIIVTNLDHEANISPWLRVATERGVIVKTWKVRPEAFELDLDDLDALLTDRTKLVCIAQVSNILGAISPIGEVVQRAHARGARVFVDGVAYAPHRLVDVRAWDVDFYVLSLYKVFGPRLGLLYGKREHLLELSNINHVYVPKDAIPYKLQPGGFSYELAAGVPAIVEYLEELGRRALDGETGEPAPRARLDAAFSAIAAAEAHAMAPLLAFLGERRDVRLFGWPTASPAHRVSTVSVAVEGRDMADLARRLAERRIGVRAGDFHSRRLLQDLGVPGGSVLRISLAHYNSPEEIEHLIDQLGELFR